MKESSIDYLLSIVNDTGVNLCVVGTEEGYDDLFKTRKIERRTGINLSNEINYYNNKGFFSLMVKDLWQYQWFDERVSLTNDIIEALYENTYGYVDDLVKLYTYMHKDYLERPKGKRPVIDAEFIKRTSELNFPRREELARHSLAIKKKALGKEQPELKIAKTFATRKELAEKNNLELEAVSEEAIDIVEGEKKLATLDDTSLAERTALQIECIGELLHFSNMFHAPYTEQEVNDAVEKTMKKASMFGACKDKIISESHRYLESHKKRSSKRAKPGPKNDARKTTIISRTYGG